MVGLPPCPLHTPFVRPGTQGRAQGWHEGSNFWGVSNQLEGFFGRFLLGGFVFGEEPGLFRWFKDVWCVDFYMFSCLCKFVLYRLLGERISVLQRVLKNKKNHEEFLNDEFLDSCWITYVCFVNSFCLASGRLVGGGWVWLDGFGEGSTNPRSWEYHLEICESKIGWTRNPTRKPCNQQTNNQTSKQTTSILATHSTTEQPVLFFDGEVCG